jgi:hypothetical protein
MRETGVKRTENRVSGAGARVTEIGYLRKAAFFCSRFDHMRLQ